MSKIRNHTASCQPLVQYHCVQDLSIDCRPTLKKNVATVQLMGLYINLFDARSSTIKKIFWFLSTILLHCRQYCIIDTIVFFCLTPLALCKYRTVGHGIVLYMSVQTWYSDSVQAWYSISIIVQL